MTPRRAPRPEDRGIRAERAREKILEAAVAEFGARGYAGARTAAIAARADVNPQLISYYFGGKQGLLEELRRRWQEAEASVAPPDASFGESVAAWLDATLDRPEWARLVMWQAMGDCPFARAEDQAEFAQAQRSKMAQAAERMRLRQRAGEVTGEVTPGFALLVTYSVIFAPITMPQFVRDLFGDDPLSPATRHQLGSQLVRILGTAGD
jgi:TetR/AcrR family transcriptional regulator